MTKHERLWYILFMVTLIGACFGAAGALIGYAHSAELPLPDYVTCGAAKCETPGSELNKFGTYSLHYYQRRWKRMCKTGAHYDAVREANDMGQEWSCE